MWNFEQIKLGADILLVMGVVFLAYRVMMSGSISGKTAQLLILEASLKGLIKDAEGSGRSLNEELTRRQNQLERLLGDLTATENRLSMQRQAIEQQIATQSQQSRQQTFATAPAKAQAAASAPQRAQAPEAPSFESSVRQKTTPRAIERTTQQIRSTAEDVRALTRQIEVSRVAADNRIETRDEEVAAQHAEPIAEASAEQAIDNRLGVLGAMKRQVQTL